MNVVAISCYCLALAVALLQLYVDAVVLDDIDIDYLNSNYINMSNFEASVNRKRNSGNTVNLKYQLIKDLPDDVYVKFYVSTRAFGYEIPTGLRFSVKLCDPYEGKKMFDMLYAPLGVKDCPPKKGLYEVRDHEIDFTKAPFSLLSGVRLKTSIEIVGNGDERIAMYKIFVLT